ncbi:MAG: putative sulfoacetate transporter SauU [Smithella sp. PtaU1.Bin162]|nr:MAG: putative sulfoacetate transporter SauU [Smithella sp. PtaU1.Bin162]
MNTSIKKQPNNAAITVDREYPPSVLSWSIWGLGAMLYAVGFFQRTAPSVMTKELMVDFNITAAALGQLASFFFYAYVMMQIPTGILSSILGPRKLMVISAFVTTAGTILFAISNNFVVAASGLLMVGGAVAMAIVITLELAGRWLPPDRFAIASGLIMVVGVIGAFSAGMPLRIMISEFGWRACMVCLSGFSFLIGVLSWLIIKDDPSEKGYLSYSQKTAEKKQTPKTTVIENIKTSLSYRNTWLMLLVPCSLIGAMLSFSGLWGVPYLNARYGLDAQKGALICSVLLISFAVGSPILGYISDHQNLRKPVYIVGFLLAAVFWFAIILIEVVPIWCLVIMLVIIGFFTGAMPLSYAIGRESAPVEVSGIITGIVVTGIMIGPAIVQPVTGWVLDRHWSGILETGIRIYTIEAYRSAFIPMLVWIGISSLLVLGIKETYCGKKRGEL